MIIRFVDQFKGEPETSLLSVCGEDAFKNALSLSLAVRFSTFNVYGILIYTFDGSVAGILSIDFE